MCLFTVTMSMDLLPFSFKEYRNNRLEEGVKRNGKSLK